MAKKKSGSNGSTKVVVKVDKALMKLWLELLHEVEQSTAKGAQAWDDRYEAIDAIMSHEPEAFLAGGYSSASEFIDAVVKEDRTTLYRNLRVAKYADPAEIEKYGPTCLDYAIALVELKNGGPLKGRTPIAFEKLKFQLVADGKKVSKRFAEMNAAELRAALTLAKGRETTSKNASPALKSLTALLKAAGVKKATASLTKTTLTLRLPVGDVAKAGKALAKFIVPAPKPIKS